MLCGRESRNNSSIAESKNNGNILGNFVIYFVHIWKT